MRLLGIALLGCTALATATAAGGVEVNAVGQIAFALDKRVAATNIYRSVLGGHRRNLTRGAGIRASEATVSPNGSKIAFTSLEKDDLASLWVMNADGSRLRKLADGFSTNQTVFSPLQPAWSPNGRSIAFGAEEGIFVVRARDGRLKKVAPGGSWPSWSPNGREIAFIRELRLHAVSVTGRHHRLLRLKAEPEEDCAPSWSPDGRRIVLAAGRPVYLPHDVIEYRSDIYSVPLRRGKVRQLTHWRRFTTKYGVSWSSAAGRIVFAARGKLWTIRPDGSDRRRITDPKRSAGDDLPVWSPNGRRIAFVRANRLGFGIFVIRANGGRTRHVTRSKRIYVGRPSWVPDSRSIVYALTVVQGTSIHVVDENGRGHRQLTHSVWDDSEPSWSPDGTSVAFTRDLVFPGGSEIFRMRSDGTRIRRLTHHTGADSAPSWSPDGKRIVFHREANEDEWITTMDAADGRRVKRIFRGTTATWSPDGSTIAVGGYEGLTLITPSGRFVRRLAVVPRTGAQTPAWSPDGAKIAFTRLSSCGEECVTYRIEIVENEGGASGVFQENALMPTWSPDGTQIAYVCPGWSICRRPVAGGAETLLWAGSPGKDASWPSWRPK